MNGFALPVKKSGLFWRKSHRMNEFERIGSRETMRSKGGSRCAARSQVCDLGFSTTGRRDRRPISQKGRDGKNKSVHWRRNSPKIRRFSDGGRQSVHTGSTAAKITLKRTKATEEIAIFGLSHRARQQCHPPVHKKSRIVAPDKRIKEGGENRLRISPVQKLT